jgi:hypothetical protein
VSEAVFTHSRRPSIEVEKKYKGQLFFSVDGQPSHRLCVDTAKISNDAKKIVA